MPDDHYHGPEDTTPDAAKPMRVFELNDGERHLIAAHTIAEAVAHFHAQGCDDDSTAELTVREVPNTAWQRIRIHVEDDAGEGFAVTVAEAVSALREQAAILGSTAV